MNITQPQRTKTPLTLKKNPLSGKSYLGPAGQPKHFASTYRTDAQMAKRKHRLKWGGSLQSLQQAARLDAQSLGAVRLSPKLTPPEREIARDMLRKQSDNERAKTIAVWKKMGVIDPPKPFAKSRQRIVTALDRTSGGRRLLTYARDPEVQQFGKDVGALTALYYTARRLPKWQSQFRTMQRGPDPTAQAMYEAQNPTGWQKFSRKFQARRQRGLKGIIPGLKAAWRVVK